MRYFVVREKSTYELAAAVQKLVEAGWQCQGGVSYEYNGGLTMTGYYLQAMTKKS